MKKTTFLWLFFALVAVVAAYFIKGNETEKGTSRPDVNAESESPSGARATADRVLMKESDKKTSSRNIAKGGAKSSGVETDRAGDESEFIGQPIEEPGESRFDRGRREAEERLLSQMSEGQRTKAQAIIDNKAELQRQTIEERWQERGWPPPPRENGEIEKQLLAMARATPKNNYRQLYDIYSELAVLNPYEPSYPPMIENYSNQVRAPDGQPIINSQDDPSLPENQKPPPTSWVGNAHIQFAAKHMGRGKFYVWIKNAGDTALQIDPNYFTMIGVDGQPYRHKRDDKMRKDLAVGEEMNGYIDFNLRMEARDLVFANSQVESVSLPVESNENQQPRQAQ